MPETSHPPHHQVPTLARALAATILGEATDLDQTTISAVIGGAAHLTEAGLSDSAQALLHLAAHGTPDPADVTARALTALHTPAPTPEAAGPAPARQPTTPAHTSREHNLDPAVLAATEQHTATTHIQALPLDQTQPGPGQPTGIYNPVPIARPPRWCDHVQTICRGCLTAWADDHTLALFDHGPAGTAAGCRCTTCTTDQPGHDLEHNAPTTPHTPNTDPA